MFVRDGWHDMPSDEKFECNVQDSNRLTQMEIQF